MNYKKLLVATTLLTSAAGIASLDNSDVAKADTVESGNYANGQDPNYGKDETMGTDENIDPSFGINDDNMGKDENIDPSYGVNDDNMGKDENIDPSFGVNEDTMGKDENIDPSFGVNDDNMGKDENIDPDYNVDYDGGMGQDPNIDPDFSVVGDKTDEDNKDEVNTPSQDTANTPATTPVKADVVKAAVLAPTATADENGNITYAKDGRKSIVAAVKGNAATVAETKADTKSDKQLLPQTGAKKEYSFVAAGTALIMGAAIMGLATVQKRKNA